MPPLRRPEKPELRSLRAFARMLSVVAIWLVAAAPSPAFAQGTGAAWTQFQGGPAHTGTAPGPAPAFAEAWALEEPIGGVTGAEGLSGPAIADGLAVTVGPDAVIAVDAVTGAERWRTERAGGPPVHPAIAGEGADAIVVFPEGYGPNPPAPAGSPSPSPSPSASPADAAAAEGTAVELVAVSLADGDERWRVELPSPSRSGVTASGDAVYVGGNDGSVTAVRVDDGEIRWTQPAGASVTSPVAVAGDLVIASALGDDERAFAVVALRADDGSQAWRYEPGVTVVFGTSIAVGDGIGFIAADDRTVRAVDLGDGTERWLARTNAIVGPSSPPLISGELVVAVDVAGQVYGLDAATGDRRWDHALNVGLLGVLTASVATDAVVVVPTVRGELFAVELATGDLVSSTDVADGLVRSLSLGDDLLIGVRSGSRPGLVALGHAADGPVFRTTSPTVFDPARFATNAALAAVPVAIVLLLAGRLLASRSGPPVLARGTPRDPIEDALDDEAAP